MTQLLSEVSGATKQKKIEMGQLLFELTIVLRAPWMVWI